MPWTLMRGYYDLNQRFTIEKETEIKWEGRTSENVRGR